MTSSQETEWVYSYNPGVHIWQIGQLDKNQKIVLQNSTNQVQLSENTEHFWLTLLQSTGDNIQHYCVYLGHGTLLPKYVADEYVLQVVPRDQVVPEPFCWPCWIVWRTADQKSHENKNNSSVDVFMFQFFFVLRVYFVLCVYFNLELFFFLLCSHSLVLLSGLLATRVEIKSLSTTVIVNIFLTICINLFTKLDVSEGLGSRAILAKRLSWHHQWLTGDDWLNTG